MALKQALALAKTPLAPHYALPMDHLSQKALPEELLEVQVLLLLTLLL